MAKKKSEVNEVAELLKTLVIVQLRLAGATGENIRSIVGGDMNRVSQILKAMPRVRGREGS